LPAPPHGSPSAIDGWFLMSDILSFDKIASDSAVVVGGKGLSLGLMTQAGLPVPSGFCITCDAYRRLNTTGLASDKPLAQRVIEEYRYLGAGQVAVRSSATAEDGSANSFAGQQETLLGVCGEQRLLDAIEQCWASLHSERARAYRQQQNITDDGLAMAVVVQRLVPAEVAGVLFTRDPLDPHGQRMLVEASWGLGESVVSGRVTPDRFFVDRQSRLVLERHISTKTTEWTPDGPAPVADAKQKQPCLSNDQLAELAQLAIRVENFYGEPRDVEWAWAEGQFWLLQARPITAGGAAEREQVRQEEIAALKAKAEPDGTVWSRYNLSEILPEPTPMTWAIVRRFMSGQGGFGLMYRDLGFEPDPALDEEGIYDLVCGRPYCNLSREPRMQSSLLPFEHRFAELKANPTKALYPVPTPNPAKASWRFWVFLPWIIVKDGRAAAKRDVLLSTFAESFTQRIVPAYLEKVKEASALDLKAFANPTLLDHLEALIRLTLIDFARDSLKPTALAALAQAKVEAKLKRSLGPERARTALGELIMGVHPDSAADLPAALQRLATGDLSRDAFLSGFGHRASQEMELAQPRWAETTDTLDRLVKSDRVAGAEVLRSPGVAPGAGSLFEGQCPARQAGASEYLSPGHPSSSTSALEQVAREARLSASQRTALEKDVHTLHTYLGLRETAKHYLLMGYAQIRRVLVELDQRHQLNGGIYFLTPAELPRLVAGEDLTGLIVQRRRRRTLALSLEVPQVLFSDDLDAIGRPTTVEGAATLQGVPLSAGVAEGPALVLHQPDLSSLPPEPYILVCPTTDPAWVPLFAHAKGLIMETGGILSHGAIVAREFGLPAVAGLPDILKRLSTGQRVRVDGAEGKVTVLKEDR
jgi:rifampicin phosphotransferase